MLEPPKEIADIVPKVPKDSCSPQKTVPKVPGSQLQRNCPTGSLGLSGYPVGFKIVVVRFVKSFRFDILYHLDCSPILDLTKLQSDVLVELSK